MHVYMYICELQTSKANKATNLRALFSIFIEKRLLRWDSNPRPPAFKAVALPTEPLRLLSWFGFKSHKLGMAVRTSAAGTADWDP